MLYQWYDTGNGKVLSNPGQGDCSRDDPRAGQLLVRVGGRQRLVCVGADRGPPGAAGGCGGWPTGCWRRWTSRSSTTAGRRPRATSTRRSPAIRRPASSMAATTSTRACRLPQQRALQRPADRDLHRHGPPPDAGRRVVALVADTAAAAVRHRPRLLHPGQSGSGYWRDLHRPAVGQGVPRLGGPLHLPGHLADVRADVRRRHVRGADGQPGRPRDDLGHAQLRVSTTCAGRRCRSVRDPGARLPGVGHVAVEHRRRHRRLRRVRRRGPGVRRPAKAVAWCTTCATEDTVSPHASAIALPVAPQQAYANLVALRADYPGIYTPTAASTTRSTRRPGRSATGAWCSTSR